MKSYKIIVWCFCAFSVSAQGEKVVMTIAARIPALVAPSEPSGDRPPAIVNDPIEAVSVLETLWKMSPTTSDKLASLQGATRGKCVLRKGSWASTNGVGASVRSLSDAEMGPWQLVNSEVIVGRYEKFPVTLLKNGTLTTSKAFVFSPWLNSPTLSVAEGDFMPIEFQDPLKRFGRSVETKLEDSYSRKEFGVRVASSPGTAGVTILTRGSFERGSRNFAEKEEALCILVRVK